MIEAGHMLPPDERNRLAEPATMLVDQLRPMFILLGRHRIEDLRGGGEVVAQALGVPAIDPSVVFFGRDRQRKHRSEEHTSELQSLMRISYAVFCLKKKTHK